MEYSRTRTAPTGAFNLLPSAIEVLGWRAQLDRRFIRTEIK